ncbi:MAG: hypothetical protein WBA38_04170 [Gordonia sp. (in: high G+C Gram-positive bacteria)]|uniref:DUF7427 family protein n=1 Tax=Gordonia sp. (in: high G+C Gram-positive bacteria) TaxID=84139 RepID=UPI003C743289
MIPSSLSGERRAAGRGNGLDSTPRKVTFETTNFAREVHAMTAAHGWIGLIAAITAWEVFALRTNPDLLLSRGADRARAVHPAANIAVHAAVIATAGHLLRAWPDRIDPFALVSR